MSVCLSLLRSLTRCKYLTFEDDGESRDDVVGERLCLCLLNVRKRLRMVVAASVNSGEANQEEKCAKANAAS